MTNGDAADFRRNQRPHRLDIHCGRRGQAINSGCTESTSSATATSNNRLSGLSYDASGNTQSDGIYSYTWDGESQLKTAAGVTYNYDGDGRRVAKVGSKLYWYGSGGEILAETDASGNTLNEYIFFGGKRVAMVPATGNPLYYAEDMLGSSRVIVQSGALCYDADLTPFGGERAYTSTCARNYKFEGKERDTETGNDDFGERYYSWRLGRWLSSDWSAVPVPVPYANLTNPQTLNLYAMIADDPESFADLDGHVDWWAADQHPACAGSNGCATEQAYLKRIGQSDTKQNNNVANAAANQEGSGTYEYGQSKGKYPAGTNKCNEFVADTIESTGAARPRVPRSGILGWLGFTRDPTAKEWATMSIAGWSAPDSVAHARPGDVIAVGHHDDSEGHVGVVVGPGLTASVNAHTTPAGIVTVNNWGFRPAGQNEEHSGDAVVVRHYIGDDQ